MTALGLFILALGALLTFMVLLIQEKNKTEQEKNKTEAALKQTKLKELEALAYAELSESNFEAACMGVTQLLMAIQDKKYDKSPGIYQLRGRLKDRTIKFLTRFAKEKSSDYRDQERLARVDAVIAVVHKLYGDMPKCKEMYGKAIGVYEGLLQQFPKDAKYKKLASNAHNWLGLAEYEAGEVKEAATEFSQAIEILRKGVQIEANPQLLNNLAWLQVTCPMPEFHNAKEAVALAKQAVDATPNVCPISANWRGMYCNTLGVAEYRAGNMKAAVQALNESMKLRQGGDGWDWWFLAMAYCKMDNQKLMQLYYNKAVTAPPSMDLPHETMAFCQAEAEALIPKKVQKKPEIPGSAVTID
ncbi:MAG TPA: hypothetical protein VGY66_16965 [Gemmataceae bacterium]|nr:hypothetical protein [Gemmataceae bacterium]